MELSTPTTIQPFGKTCVFTREEAEALVPVIRRITKAALEQIESKMPMIAQAEGEKREALENEVHTLFDQWQSKVHRLGGVTKGMWLVDFDNGEGYYCWRYPETRIEYFHGYKEGFTGRVKLP